MNIRKFFMRQNVFKVYNFTKTNATYYLTSYKKTLMTCNLAFNLFGVFNKGPELPRQCRYWLIENLPDLLEEADKLYYEENYLEVYELLNRLKYQDNVEVQWRICRVLFKMSRDQTKFQPLRANMITEAYELITKTMDLNPNNAEIHKWKAIILDMKTSLEGTIKHIHAAPLVKYHLQKSLEINPKDPTVLYMLGYWCYEMSKLTWFQRQIAKILFDYPPESSCEEALQYFLKAEQVKPRFFIGNMYMLGLCSYSLGKYYMARYYLKMAAELPVKNDVECMHSENAKRIADKLIDYEISIFSLCN